MMMTAQQQKNASFRFDIHLWMSYIHTYVNVIIIFVVFFGFMPYFEYFFNEFGLHIKTEYSQRHHL